MPTHFTPKIITANRLLEGDVVYLTEQDTWSPHFDHAAILTDEADADLRLLDASARTDEVVGVYLADVTEGRDSPRPAHFREAFRAKGPGNYAHGKQEETHNV